MSKVNLTASELVMLIEKKEIEVNGTTVAIAEVNDVTEEVSTDYSRFVGMTAKFEYPDSKRKTEIRKIHKADGKGFMVEGLSGYIPWNALKIHGGYISIIDNPQEVKNEQPDYSHLVGMWVKCIKGDSSHNLKKDKWYQVEKISDDGSLFIPTGSYDCYPWNKESINNLFDISNPLPYNPDDKRKEAAEAFLKVYDYMIEQNGGVWMPQNGSNSYSIHINRGKNKVIAEIWTYNTIFPIFKNPIEQIPQEIQEDYKKMFGL